MQPLDKSNQRVRSRGGLPVGACLLLFIAGIAACRPEPREPGVMTPTIESTSTAVAAGSPDPLASPLDPQAGSTTFLPYEDLTAGFRIEHPSDWTVVTSPGSEAAIEFPPVIGERLGVRAGIFMVGFRLEAIGLYTLDEIFDSFGASLSEQVLVDPPADIRLSGVQGYQASFLDLEIEAQGRLLTFIDEGQGYVIITLVQPAVHFDTFQPVFEAMLETLELLPPTAAP